MMGKRSPWMLEGSLLGSLIFWLPMVMARAVFAPDWSALLIVFPFTLVLPVFACFVMEIFADQWKRPAWKVAFAMLLGIWVSGPFWITLANTLSPGQGFHMAGSWSFVALMTAAFPLTTIMLSTYHGSLGALFLTTIAVLVFSASGWTFRPILRRCVICRFALSR